MFLREKKPVFPFILSGLFDPEGLGAGTRRYQKWKRPAQARQANFPLDSTPSTPINTY
ncbi:hypothetical protein ACQCVP_08915 [Rossellomorea vietnamensis]